jgi:hypothetical protein
MKRVDIYYGGEHYSIGGRDLSDVEAEVKKGLDSGSTYWLVVNTGEGKLRLSSLALTPGVSIALSAADED